MGERGFIVCLFFIRFVRLVKFRVVFWLKVVYFVRGGVFYIRFSFFTVFSGGGDFCKLVYRIRGLGVGGSGDGMVSFSRENSCCWWDFFF